jgi:putative peptidoglycan lipid II flippase
VAEALVWWSISLPFQGMSLLLSRTFFSLQRPWLTTALSGANLVVNALLALALYKPLGVGGVVLGTVAGTVGMTVAQALYLRPGLGGIEGPRILSAGVRMLAGAGMLGLTAYGVWYGLDEALGRSLAAQIASVGAGIVAGLAVYAAAVWVLRVPEARQILDLVRSRGAQGPPAPGGG